MANYLDPRRTEPSDDPGADHRRLYEQIVHYSAELGPVLEDQFAHSKVRPEAYCDGCFDIEVTGDVPTIPAGVECPLSFPASPDDRTYVEVLLWHERGQVTGVEISWIQDEINETHPSLKDINISEGPRVS